MGNTWTYSAGVWTKTGSTREALLPRDENGVVMTFPGAGAMRCTVGAPAHNVKVALLSSRYFDTCWELGIEGANVVIQRRSLGGAPTVEATAAHGLPAGVPFTLEGRYVDGRFSVFLNGSTTPAVTFNNTAGTLNGYRHCGFLSSVAGATVTGAELCSLSQLVSPATEKLFIACDGNILALTDEDGLRTVRGGVYRDTGPVVGIDFEQKFYGIDGTHAAYVDARTYTFSLWGADSGDGVLPGASETSLGSGVYIPGTCRLRFLTRYMARLILTDDPQDPQNIWGCRVADANDWNITNRTTPGRAFATPASVYGKIGEPIVSAIEATRQVLVIGCKGSVWRMNGDPALGVPSFDKCLTYGVSGPFAMCEIGEGLVMAHCPAAGLVLIPAFGNPVQLTAGVLTEELQFPVEQAGTVWDVLLLRDPVRKLVYCFKVPKDGGSRAGERTTCFVYDERIGGFIANEFGPIPYSLPYRIGPTAVCSWRGVPVLGTRDGYLLVFDPAVFDDDGEAIECLYAMQAMDEGSEHQETILDRFLVTPTGSSGSFQYTLLGGITAEQAWGGRSDAPALTLLSGTVALDLTPVDFSVRAGCMVLRFSQMSSTEGFGIEVVEVATRLGERLANDFTPESATPADPDAPPTGEIGAEEDDTPTPGGGGGGGGPAPPPVLIPFADNVFGIETLNPDDDTLGPDIRDGFIGIVIGRDGPIEFPADGGGDIGPPRPGNPDPGVPSGTSPEGVASF